MHKELVCEISGIFSGIVDINYFLIYLCQRAMVKTNAFVTNHHPRHSRKPFPTTYPELKAIQRNDKSNGSTKVRALTFLNI